MAIDFCGKQKATSKNSFLMIWARDFGSIKVAERLEYFVYFGLFEAHYWNKRSVQIAKGEFLEVPNKEAERKTALL